jgi:uncharacterized protein DUF4424
MRTSMAVILFASLVPIPALANDTTAELATGGLVFVRTDNIEMRSEELFISTQEIKVRYRFANTSGKDVTTLVAFPMPDITVESPDANMAVPTEDPHNILGFTTIVDGQPVITKVEQKVLAAGTDRTETLRQLGIPLAPHLKVTDDALDRLPRDRWDELIRLRLAEIDEFDIGQGMEKHLRARWTLKTTYHWQQTFPAGREIVIEHRYKPSVGGSVETNLGAPGSIKENWFAEYRRKYCLDQDLLSSLERARRAGKREFGAPFSEERVAYVLKTGANWAGPIKEFRLVVDKGDPTSLVSFCGQGVRKIGPTQFEMRKTNFTPASDLFVLFLRNLPQRQ